MEDNTEVTQRILNITLEIIYLLTGEDYIIVKKPGGRTPNSKRLQVVEGFCRKQNSKSFSPPRHPTCERSKEKILELTQKMIGLLTGEVPIRCQDVTVYFSMEEWEYLEGHKDLYKDVMMEDLQTHLTPDGSESRHTSEDIGFPMVTSDCETEDGMIIDVGPKDVDPFEGDTGPEVIVMCERDTGPDGIDPYEGDMGPKVIDPYEGDVGSDGIDLYEGDAGSDGIDLYEEDPRPGSIEPYEDDPRPHGIDSYEDDPRPENIEPYEENPRPESIESYEEDPRPESIEPYEEDPRPESIDGCKGDTPTSSVEGLHVRIKKEPLSDEEYGLSDDNCAKRVPYTCVRIKEEPQQSEEIQIPGDDPRADKNPKVFSHVKVETIPAEEDSRSTPNSYTPEDQGHSTPTDIKEEPEALTNVLDICKNADHSQERPSNSLAETFAYEVEIPMDKVPAKGPDNASLYSVRQKEDSMEILYHCPSCYKGFSSNLDLARHQVIHTVDKLFICSLCGKSFTEMSFLVKHQVIHTDLKLCVCPVCGGCFYSETSLAKHQKTHSLPLFCSTCGKCYFNKTELAIHERKHSGERPFGCHICGKHFIAKSVLNKHLLIHTTVDLRK